MPMIPTGARMAANAVLAGRRKRGRTARLRACTCYAFEPACNSCPRCRGHGCGGHPYRSHKSPGRLMPISPHCKGRCRVACFPVSMGTLPGAASQSPPRPKLHHRLRSTGACSAPSLSIWGAASTAASTSQATLPPTSGGFAATCSTSSRNLVPRSSSIPGRKLRLHL